MKVAYLGTTTLLFDDGTDQILFDAHVTRPSLLKIAFRKIGTDRVLTDEILQRFGVNRLKGIFISHTHHDHILDAAYIARKCGAGLYGSESALNVGRGGGVQEEQLHLMQGNDEVKIGKFTIKTIPSMHSKPTIFNNDIGKVIDKPMEQPARVWSFKEGGSVDFLVTHEGRTYLIRPSYNYVEGELDGIHADIVFLGIGGLSKGKRTERNIFFRETIEKTNPELIIPLHWDNFFRSLRKPIRNSLVAAGSSSLNCLWSYCSRTHHQMYVQWPLSAMEF